MNSELMETFEKNSSELYWLAYLLTGNEDRSVQAFGRALDTGENANPAFNGFMNEWARKLIIVEALGGMEGELRRSVARVARAVSQGDEKADKDVQGKWTLRQGIAKEEFEQAVLAIDAFPRSAMLLTIFEGMTVGAAANLLHADQALTAAAQRIGIVQLTRNLAGGDGRDPSPQGHSPFPVLSLG
jgi:hypothetical protein